MSEANVAKFRTVLKLARAYLINTAAVGHIEAQLLTAQTAETEHLSTAKATLMARITSTEGKLIELVTNHDHNA